LVKAEETHQSLINAEGQYRPGAGKKMLSELMSEADEDTDSSEISHGAGPPGATSLVQIKSFSQVDSQSQVEAQA
jgi:hypothetical protein